MTDLHGNPWTPCPDCPRAAVNGGDGTEWSCPSRRHRVYCDHVREAVRWRPWLDVVRSAPPEDTPGPDLPAAAPPPPPDTPAPEWTEADAATLRAVTRCPHRGPKTQAGCNCARLCLRDSREVRFEDCKACVGAGLEAAAEESSAPA